MEKFDTLNGKPSILVVDDEPGVVKAVARIFVSSGIRVETATDPLAALDRIGRLAGLRLVISDFLMPEMDGLEFLTRVRQFNPEILRIILTGNADLEAVLTAINQVGVYKFILKPWNQHDLYWTVVRALEMDELRREKEVLQARMTKQSQLLERIEKIYPGITKVEKDEDGAVILPDTGFSGRAE